ncbi:jg5221 [Pararge aegeria aegeria]|uniref:Jg5221 protein n=1 Tax=Pararge aegeria aegeria TaxID=348720 RepID=A0A8S4R1P2_9NEOP|nr:jg5221 [Pararge aegeria aegeria]
MIRITLIWAVVAISHLCLAYPAADPDPLGFGHKTHVKIHIPHEVRTVHHHHVEKIPVYKEVPIYKEVPVLHEVPVVKHVPILKTVHVPIVNTVHVEKPVFIPVKEHLGLWH